MQRAIALAAVLATSAWTGCPGAAAALDLAHLNALRQRQQFDEAEKVCRDEMGRTSPRDPAQAQIAAELIRTLTLKAASAPAADRDALWAKARQAAADFLRLSPPHPRWQIVRFQDALTLLAQGELGREEHELGILPPAGLTAARQALREASSILEPLQQELVREVPLRRRSPPRSGELSADELSSLADQAGHQLARAQKNQAMLYESGSTDRLALLLAAAESHSRLLEQLPERHPLRPSVQLELAECQRLLGKPEEAVELARALNQPDVEAAVRARAQAELIRLAIARGERADVLALVGGASQPMDSAVPELVLARLQGLLFLAAGAGPQQTDGHQQQAAETARQIEAEFGPYWGRRANQLVANSLPRGGVKSVELLRRLADDFYLRHQFDQAIATYDEASTIAQQSGDASATFELVYKAALVEQERGRYLAAAHRLQLLATRQPAHPQAAAAHLLAAWNAAQAAQTDPAAAAVYADLLTEHVSLWRTSPTADRAHVWLGQLRASKTEWREAIEALAAVSRSSPHYPAAVEGLARCWRQELAALAASGKSPVEAARQAAAFFRRAILGPDNRWPEQWTDADRTAALAASELITGYDIGSASDAEELLRRALAGSPDAPSDWVAAARAQLVVALAAQGGRQNDALGELLSIGHQSTEEVLHVLDGLTRIAASADGGSRPAIASLQLAAADRLAGSGRELTAAQQIVISRIRADALAAQGRREEARVAYARLADDHPNDGPIQEGYARLLSALSDPASLRLALDRWRIVAARSQPYSPRWCEAKYSVALVQFKLGDKASAATLVRFILETPPGLGGTSWEAPFRELLKQCGDSP